MEKDKFYESCRREERHFKKFFDTLLLSELLRINYEYSMQEYHNITGEDIFKSTIRKEKYSDKEKEEIIKNAIILLNIKYNYPIRKDILKQFNKLDFKRI